MKKIMFNDRYGLTQAVLSGMKTQTRRLIPQEELNSVFSFRETYYDDTFDYLDNKELFEHFYFTEKLGRLPYKTGDVVAVAQEYKDLVSPRNVEEVLFGYYKIGKEYFTMEEMGAGWSNKMFVKADLMPHQIRITNVRIERLQDISDEDCIKEGIDCYKGWIKLGNTSREAYASLIDKVSGKGTWERNPFVFVYDFELIK